MTDRERLLEQVREAEGQAAVDGDEAARWIRGNPPYNQKYAAMQADNAYRCASAAAHHALTALALLEAIDQTRFQDDPCVMVPSWESLAEAKARLEKLKAEENDDLSRFITEKRDAGLGPWVMPNPRQSR